MDMLSRMRLRGFRSIEDMDLELRSLNVLIGANGAGKSTLVAFFKLLGEMIGGRLQHYLAETGRATSNLFYGPKVTPQLAATLVFDTEAGPKTYDFRLSHAAGDVLFFDEETLSVGHGGGGGRSQEIAFSSGALESRVSQNSRPDETLRGTFHHLLASCRTYHFHDTSATARVRRYCYVGDHAGLASDAANLAALLYRWRSQKAVAYSRIVRTIQQVAPFFGDFVLEPEGPQGKDITLNWTHRDSDLVLGPHQFSDGTLRIICLIVLLMQPVEELPKLVVIDEPELGLHPFALNVIASLLQAAALHTQVLVSTQSSRLLREFQPEDVIVVQRQGRGSTFERPDPAALEEWLDEYDLGEVWEKNIIGGGPH